MIHVDYKCPSCGAGVGGPAGVHSNGVSIWCLRCGWAQNTERADRS